MKKFTITKMSGEFRLKTGMNSDEMEKFIKDNWDFRTDYCDEFENFAYRIEALARFNELKTECCVFEYPSNKVMQVYWIQLDEMERDEDGNDDFVRTLSEFYPAQDV